MNYATATNRAARSLAKLTCAAAALVFVSGARANENKSVIDALDFTRAFVAKHHLVAAVEMRNRKGKLTAFQYDRVADVERLRKKGETFARKDGGSWVKSDDWGQNGSPLEREETEELEQLGDVVEGILKTKDEPALRTWRAVDDAKPADPRLRSFEASRGESGAQTYPRLTFEQQGDAQPGRMLLKEAVGPVFVGRDVMVATIRFGYGSGLDKSEVAPPQMPTPAAPSPR